MIGGLTFAGCLAAQGADAGRGWIDAVVRAAIGGAAFAVCMWWFVHRRQTRDNNPMLASLTRDQRRTAYRAAFRGAAPADPQIRHAAVELARRRLGESLNHRTPVAALLAALILVCIVAASVGSLWWAVGAAALAAVLVSMFVTPARLCRRLELLETPPI